MSSKTLDRINEALGRFGPAVMPFASTRIVAEWLGISDEGVRMRFKRGQFPQEALLPCGDRAQIVDVVVLLEFLRGNRKARAKVAASTPMPTESAEETEASAT